MAFSILAWQHLLTKAALTFISWGHRHASYSFIPSLASSTKTSKTSICFAFIYDGLDGALLPSPGAHRQWGQFSWRVGTCHVGCRKESRLVNRVLQPNTEFLDVSVPTSLWLNWCLKLRVDAASVSRLAMSADEDGCAESCVCDEAWGITLRHSFIFWMLSTAFCLTSCGGGLLPMDQSKTGGARSMMTWDGGVRSEMLLLLCRSLQLTWACSTARGEEPECLGYNWAPL